MVAKFNMTRDGLIAGYNAQEELVAELLAALITLVNNIPVPEIKLARSAWGNTTVACVLLARRKAEEAIAKAEGE